MSRGLWFAAGAGAGIYAVVRGRRAAEALTVEGIGDRLSGLAVGLRMFRDEVAAGRAEKETQLRDHLALPPDDGAARPDPARQLAAATEDRHQDTTEDTTDGHR